MEKKSLKRKLLEMKAEVIIARKKTGNFEVEAALNNLVYALSEALLKIEEEEKR